MPLEHSSSSKAFKRNVGTLMREVGKSPRIQTRAQALKIAYETQRRARGAGGGVAGFDTGGVVPPMMPPQNTGILPPPQQSGGMPQPGVPMPGNAPVGVAGPATAMPQPGGMNPTPVSPGTTPPAPQWASGVAQNAAPPALPQNATPPAQPTPLMGPAPIAQPLMAANGGALPRAAGGFNMAKAPSLSTPWQTRAQDRRLHVGPVLSNVPGRVDNHQVRVPSGSFVLPAAHVSAMGQGNTLAGLSLAAKMFGGPFGASPGRIAHGPGAPKPPRMRGLADGGTPQQDYGQPVDVDISGGEYVISPEAIIHRYGDLDTGHRILDAWILSARKNEIKTLKNLPPPAKS